MAKSGWFARGANGANKKDAQKETQMTTYEIREYKWKDPDPDPDGTLYEFKTGQDFVAYVAIRAKAHESITVRYDKKNDVLYVED